MNFMGIFWLIFSYFLGSFPSGYLIGRLSGKNVLEIGWRKTSGSNVFKNVGKWQGVLTGLLDILKGYLAVWGAKKLGFAENIQVFSGVLAVIGHNWSIFLKFAGGRGIGTFIGAFLAFSPKILFFCLIPFVFLTLIWNAAIGTIIFLFTAILLAVIYQKFQTIGYFTLFSLLPIFLKRLSPIEEIFSSKNGFILAKNRLIFDNDEALWELRIKKIIRERSDRIAFILKIFLFVFLLPPRISWKGARWGAKIAINGIKAAAKPVEKIFFPEKVITEIFAEDFKKMMIAASKKIVFHQEEINRINVWPVADKDTGYNLAATLLGIEGTIRQKRYNSFIELSKDIQDAAMINARGNAGMIFTGYLLKFLEAIKNLEKLDTFHFAKGLKKGEKGGFQSILNPSEGTILDVMKAISNKANEIMSIKKEKNIIKLLKECYKEGQKALMATKEKLPALKEANVVDAGALGFIKILEAWLESLEGKDSFRSLEDYQDENKQAKEKTLDYNQYEIIFRIKKNNKLEIADLKEKLLEIGNSIDFLDLDDQVKFHIHTDSPEKIKEMIDEFDFIEWHQESLFYQKDRNSLVKKPLGLVIGESADLPTEILEKNRIIVIPFSVNFPNKEIVAKEKIFEKIKEAIKTKKPLPTTAAPSFNQFLIGYRQALEEFEEILVITLSSKLSGAYSSARIARSMMKEKHRITVFDCNTAEAGEGLVVLKILELISQGKEKKEILEFLKDFCPKVRLIGAVKDLRFVVRSGRIKLPKIFVNFLFLISKIGFIPLFQLKEGKITFAKIKYGKNLIKILTEEIKRNKNKKKLKLAINYGENLKDALLLKKELEKEKDFEVLFVNKVSPVVGVYTGSEAIIIGFYEE